MIKVYRFLFAAGHDYIELKFFYDNKMYSFSFVLSINKVEISYYSRKEESEHKILEIEDCRKLISHVFVSRIYESQW